MHHSGDLFSAQTDIVQLCSFPSAHIYHAVNYCDYAQFFGNLFESQELTSTDSSVIMLKSPLSGIIFIEVFRLSEELQKDEKSK